MSLPLDQIRMNIRALMAHKGVSQTTVGNALGLSQTAISKRLLGGTRFTLDELVALSDLLGVELASLVGGER